MESRVTRKCKEVEKHIYVPARVAAQGRNVPNRKDFLSQVLNFSVSYGRKSEGCNVGLSPSIA